VLLLFLAELEDCTFTRLRVLETIAVHIRAIVGLVDCCKDGCNHVHTALCMHVSCAASMDRQQAAMRWHLLTFTCNVHAIISTCAFECSKYLSVPSFLILLLVETLLPMVGM
jgi:hypothetical protein